MVRIKTTRALGIGLASVVVALVLVGQVIFLVSAARSGLSLAGDAPSLPQTGSLPHRLAPILSAVLGPSDRGIRRFRITGAYPGSSNRRLEVVSITWAINNDLSAGTVGNGAQVDVYAMLRAIYSSHLPIGLVKLTGTYPIPDRRGRPHETVVMRLAMDRSAANAVEETGWDNLDAQGLWPLVRRLYVHPDLQPVAAE
jgi:hypothetical protein